MSLPEPDTASGSVALPISADNSQDQRPGRRKIDAVLTEENPNPKKAKQEEEAEAAHGLEESAVTEHKNQPGKTTAAASVAEDSSGSAGAPRPPHLPPYPTTGKIKDLRERRKQYDKIKSFLVEEIDENSPTMREPKDTNTTHAVQSTGDKAIVLRAARSIVSVSLVTQDGQRRVRFTCTGIIIKQWSESPGDHHAIVVTSYSLLRNAGTMLDPLRKLSVSLPDKKTILDAELIYSNDHYNIALLRLSLGFPLELPSIGGGPEYGQEVFLLARDGDAPLRVRHGNIKWLEESDIMGRDYYMFLSCKLPECGSGGMVIDHDGEVRGMAFYWTPYHGLLSISTIVTCVDMFMQFSRVARPILGFCVRTVAMLDVELLEEMYDIGIMNGFIVDVVFDDDAENLGIRRGNVIISINGQDALTIPELEDYLLSLGWDYLRDKSISRKDIKLRVCDLQSSTKRDMSLPLRFSDKPERDEPL